MLAHYEGPAEAAFLPGAELSSHDASVYLKPRHRLPLAGALYADDLYLFLLGPDESPGKVGVNMLLSKDFPDYHEAACAPYHMLPSLKLSIFELHSDSVLPAFHRHIHTLLLQKLSLIKAILSILQLREIS